MSVINFQDLYQAYRVCRRRKRKTANTQRYEMQLLDNLFDTLAELQGRSYQPQRSLCFVAKQPKAREIHAADFSDRVIHHWLVPRLEAIYEPVFIHDVYSNRQGKGAHKAVQRLQSFMRSTHSGHYFLQLDIANFFNTIDRSVLFNLIQQRLQKAVAKAKVFREEAVVMRWLVHVILKHDVTDACFYRGRASDFALIPPHKRLSEAGDSKGLPIGNLTSQFFANVYMNELDQFIKHQLKCRYYIRYVDDYVLLGNSVAELLEFKQCIALFLFGRLKLRLRKQYYLKPVGQGADFLGYIVRPHYCLVRRRVVGNLRQRLHRFQSQMVSNNGFSLNVSLDQLPLIRSVLVSYWGHFKHASSYRLRQSLLAEFPWLMALFSFETETPAVICLPDGHRFSGYHGQVKVIRRYYPLAHVRIQRGIDWDQFSPLLKQQECAALQIIRVVAVETNERYRGGLKKRLVSHIEFNRSLL